MRRYWIDESNISVEEVLIEGSDFHHICEVCRMGLGDRFEVINKKALFVEIKEITKKKAIAQILEERLIEPLPRPYIHLALSLPRFNKVDFIVEKSVELGVKSICPFVSDYSFVSKLGKIPGAKLERWKKIVRSATQQSGRSELMEIQNPVTLHEILQNINQQDSTRGLFLYEGESSLDLKSVLQGLSSSSDTPENIFVFVGSEGGFSTKEVELFKSFGLEAITMGPQVLRVETACVAIVSVIKYELDQMKIGRNSGSI